VGDAIGHQLPLDRFQLGHSLGRAPAGGKAIGPLCEIRKHPVLRELRRLDLDPVWPACERLDRVILRIHRSRSSSSKILIALFT